MTIWKRIKKWADGFYRDLPAAKEGLYYLSGEQVALTTDDHIKQHGLRPIIPPLGVRNDN